MSTTTVMIKQEVNAINVGRNDEGDLLILLADNNNDHPLCFSMPEEEARALAGCILEALELADKTLTISWQV